MLTGLWKLVKVCLWGGGLKMQFICAVKETRGKDVRAVIYKTYLKVIIIFQEENNQKEVL